MTKSSFSRKIINDGRKFYRRGLTGGGGGGGAAQNEIPLWIADYFGIEVDCDVQHETKYEFVSLEQSSRNVCIDGESYFVVKNIQTNFKLVVFFARLDNVVEYLEATNRGKNN